MQYPAIPCNNMQYHASLITADGAYHCPVGSIMAILFIKTAITFASQKKMKAQLFELKGFAGP